MLKSIKAHNKSKQFLRSKYYLSPNQCPNPIYQRSKQNLIIQSIVQKISQKKKKSRSTIIETSYKTK